VLTSAEAKGLARRYLQTDPVGRLPRKLVTTPAVERRLRRLLKMDRPAVYRPDPPEPVRPLVYDPIEAFISPAKARQRLGLVPAVPTARAVELTLDWLRHARLT
jgi:hypothetical protein